MKLNGIERMQHWPSNRNSRNCPQFDSPAADYELRTLGTTVTIKHAKEAPILGGQKFEYWTHICENQSEVVKFNVYNVILELPLWKSYDQIVKPVCKEHRGSNIFANITSNTF